MSCIDPKMPFFNHSKLFPLQKVKFLVLEIPIGQKSFLSCSAMKTRVRARNKERAMVKCLISKFFTTFLPKPRRDALSTNCRKRFLIKKTVLVGGKILNLRGSAHVCLLNGRADSILLCANLFQVIQNF